MQQKHIYLPIFVLTFPAKGSKAPAFTLTTGELGEATLATYAGKRKVLNIFPSVDTSICAASVRHFNSQETMEVIRLRNPTRNMTCTTSHNTQPKKPVISTLPIFSSFGDVQPHLAQRLPAIGGILLVAAPIPPQRGFDRVPERAVAD